MIDKENTYLLKTNKFTLRFDITSEYLIHVFIESENFSAYTDMDIDSKQFMMFVGELKSIYDNLSGTASLEEQYGFHKYLSFSALHTGHIEVEGYLCDNKKDNELNFSNSFDQTYLKEFVFELNSFLEAKFR